MGYNLNFLAGMAPVLCVLAGAFLALLAGMALRPKIAERAAFVIGLALLALALAALVLNAGKPEVFLGPLLASDGLAALAQGMILLVSMLCLLVTRQIAEDLGLDHCEYTGLVLFAAFGMMLLVSATHLLVAFVALETFSLAMYVLAGFNRRSPGNREAALKYFLPGAFAAGIFLFGAALVFGATARLDYQGFAQLCHDPGLPGGQRALMLAGFMMVMAAFAFKIGLAPFHFWVPDTYEGAPTPVTAFLSAGAKAAGVAALIRLVCLFLFPASFLNALNPGFISVGSVLAVLAVLTMTVANLTALRQDGLKRMLAYSSVAHSGYALVGLVAGSAEGMNAALLYAFVYALMNFCAFGLVVAVEKDTRQTVKIQDLAGLGFTRPVFGFLLAVAMFGLAGLPPTAGFIAKFNIFKAAVDSGHVWLVVIAVLNSLISVGYYLRVLVPLYMKAPSEKAVKPAFSGLLAVTVLACAVLILFFGVLPKALLDLFAFAFPRF